MGAALSTCKNRKAHKAKSSDTEGNRSDAKVSTTQNAAWKRTANDSVQGDGAISVQDGQKIFALIIGIDNYGHDGQYNLKGAVADAKRFQAFICAKLKVPDTNISKLHDKDATRSAIIDKFRSLEDNDKIGDDATIIIYYAGHGAVADKPSNWTDWPALDNRLEMLCPADMSFSDPSENKPLVEGIPDRTISRLLLDLSDAKGDNIIMILDCCHSAGMNRNVDTYPASMRPRRISNRLIKISPDCDSVIYSRKRLKSRSGDATIATVESGFSGSLWESHVLLAACSRRESAMEEYEEGVFTRALLKVLEENSINELTYQSWMQHIVMPDGLNQTPHWDGKHTGRRIFGSPEEAADSLRVLCRRVPGETRLSIQSGRLLGTTRGSEFEIYRTDLASDTQVLATVYVDEVDAFVSYVTVSSELDQRTIFIQSGDAGVWYARLTKVSDLDTELAVYCDVPGFMASVQTDACSTKLRVTIDPVLTCGKASLLLKVEGNTVSFHRHGGERNLLFGSVEGFPWRIPHTPLQVDNIAGIRQTINHYAHFTYHLNRESPEPITKFASIEMINLQSLAHSGLTSDMLRRAREKKEPVEVEVDMSLNTNARPGYGFIVRNNLGISNLYVYLLLFDATTLEIVICFSSQMGLVGNRNVDSRLGKEPLTLGFKSDDMRPLAFNVPADQEADICFFKFFVTTEAVDLKGMVQSSIKHATRGAEFQTPSQGNGPLAPCWASMTIPVIQRRLRHGRGPGQPAGSFGSIHTEE